MDSTSSLCLLHALPITSSLTSSFWLDLVKSACYEANHYVVFPASSNFMFSPIVFSDTPSLWSYLNTLQTDDGSLRLCVSSMGDGWRKCMFLACSVSTHTMHCSHMSQRSIYCAVVLSDVYSSVGYHDLAYSHVTLWRKALCSSSQISCFQSVSSQVTSSACCMLRAKKYLREDLILPELLLDNFSDLPEDI
jgi:hypothetical protein